MGGGGGMNGGIPRPPGGGGKGMPRPNGGIPGGGTNPGGGGKGMPRPAFVDEEREKW